MALRPPTSEQLDAINVRLDALIDAITSHPQWSPSNRTSTLYYVWDFVNRSKYMLSEYDAVKSGRAVQHPTQFSIGSGTGEKAAVKVFSEVCARTMMLDMMVNDTTGKTGMMTGNSGPPLNFGKDIKDAVKALGEDCPQEYIMAGMMG